MMFERLPAPWNGITFSMSIRNTFETRRKTPFLVSLPQRGACTANHASMLYPVLHPPPTALSRQKPTPLITPTTLVCRTNTAPGHKRAIRLRRRVLLLDTDAALRARHHRGTRRTPAAVSRRRRRIG
jgi:hypothetical protein